MFKYQRWDRRHSAPRKSTRAVRPRLEALESRPVLSTITGTVFNDLHVTGVLAANDPGIAGRTVFEDLNGTGVQAPGDPMAVTSSTGAYTLTGATSGFNLRLATFPGDNPTTPIAVPVTAATTTVNFGLQPQSTVFPTVPQSTPFAGGGGNTTNAIVESLYRNILNRTGEPSGLAFWEGQINSGTSVTTVANDFYKSTEYLTNTVNSYYKTYLGRTGEASGVQSWVNALQTGTTQQTVATDFLASSEYSADHPTDSDFVNSLYTNVLGRTGEASGVQVWLNALTTGTSRATVAADFVNSTESTTRVVNGDYTAFLERVGEPSGVNVWLNQIQTKTLTLPQVAADFFGSPEYAGLAAAAPQTLVSIAVAPVNATIPSGTTQQFTATGTFNDGSTQALHGVTWTSSNLAVATITTTGLATGVGPGSTLIAAGLSGINSTPDTLTVSA
jgi:hypothetical protein